LCTRVKCVKCVRDARKLRPRGRAKRRSYCLPRRA
jgi:hypothetical protein